MAPTDGRECDMLVVFLELMECGSLHLRIPSPYEASKMPVPYVKTRQNFCNDIHAKLEF